METEKRIQYYEKIYLFEVERREKLNARLNVPMAAIVALLGFISYLLNVNFLNTSVCLKSIFFLLIALSLISILLSCYHFKNCWSGLIDRFMPTTKEIEAYHVKLEENYKEFDGKDDLVDQYFNQFLLESYSEYASYNSKNNDYRSTQLYKAVRSITFGLSFSFLAALCFKMSAILT